MDPAPVTSPDKQIGVASHEMLRHADLNPVGKKAVGVSLKRLDVAENVVPSAAVQPHGMLPQFMKNFIHLKRCWKCFDQHSRPDAPLLDSSHFLCPFKHTIPYPSFPAHILHTCIIRIILNVSKYFFFVC